MFLGAISYLELMLTSTSMWTASRRTFSFSAGTGTADFIQTTSADHMTISILDLKNY